jgi:3-deoxy-7-phosphoheptulonate synthase
MIIVMRTDADLEDVKSVKNKILGMGLEVYESKGLNYHLIGIVGDTSKVDAESFRAIKSVEKTIHVQEPYKKASRLFHPENTEIHVGTKTIGVDKLAIIAGPCSVESQSQILEVAIQVKKAGGGFLRGGAFKPRTSPYSFQGLGEEGIIFLKNAKQATGLPIVVELMSVEQIEMYEKDIDIIQIGARNMQNYELLKVAGQTKKPVLLKRGISATIEEFLLAAEYIMAAGNDSVILCERGIRSYDNYTRNILDISAIPAIKRLSHLPVIVDPSHASGIWWMVEPLAKASIAAGADGIMVEVHNDPQRALSDGKQSIKPEKFSHLMKSIEEIARIQNRRI